MHGVEQLIIESEHTAGVRKSNLSRFGKCQPATPFAEERYAKVILKTLYLQADGRGGAAEKF
jgi:hypothetical protein